MHWLRLLLVAAAAFSCSDAYKILVYNSKYGHSHSNFLGMIADTLVDAGHNVTSLIPIIDKSVKDGTEKSRKIHILPTPEMEKEYGVDDDDEDPMSFFEFGLLNPLMPVFMGPMMGGMFYSNCKHVAAQPGLIERLKAEQYDVYISENFDVCGIGLSAAIAPKSTIGTSSSALFSWQFQEFGVERALSYRPAAFISHLDVHSTLARLTNLYGDLLGLAAFYFSRSYVNSALREAFGPGYPSVQEQSSNVAYVLVNSEPLLDFAAPTSSRVVHVPGIGAKAPKKLDEYWEGVLTRRPRTILLSFGSLAKSITLPPAMKLGIVDAISRFPEVTFIWKYEAPEDEFCVKHAAKLDNLVLTKWMPQVDILNHPNLAIFITHGGMGSTQETALRGIPGIFIPIFGDQPRNAGMMEYNGFGKVFDKFDLVSGEKLAAAIREVLEDEKYRENAKRISRMLVKKPFSSKQQLVKYTEFAAEFGASAALRPQSIDMSFIAYHNLDLVVLLSVISLISAYLSLKVTLCISKRLLRRLTKAKSD